MKKLLLILISTCCFILSSCAGLADYTISLNNGYRIDRLSVHQIIVAGEEPVKSDNDRVTNYIYVEAKVTDIWWNDEYIIAKQLHLKVNENGYEEPPKKPTDADYSYWIIDIHHHEVKGPILPKYLDDETNHIKEKIKFTPVEKLKKEVEK